MTIIKHSIAFVFMAAFAAACIVTPGDESYGDENIDEATQELAAPGTCSCNPPPDSTGAWNKTKDTCAGLSPSSQCRLGVCEWTAVPGGKVKDVGCRYSSSTAFEEVDENELETFVD